MTIKNRHWDKKWKKDFDDEFTVELKAVSSHGMKWKMKNWVSPGRIINFIEELLNNEDKRK